MIVHSYRTASGKDLIQDYIGKLSKDERIDGMSVLECMEKGRISELSIKPWQGKVWEVYFYKHNRMFYIAVEGTDIYLLHACRKQKNRTEKIDSQLVTKRARELEVLLGKNLYRGCRDAI